MSHADAAAAAPPVAPNTVKNRLRSIGASVVTQRAVTRDIVLHVTVDAPAHPERSELMDLGHRAHVAVTRDAGVGPQRLDVPLMRKVYESGQGVHAHPLGRFLREKRLADLFDLRFMGVGGPADYLVAAPARLERRDAGLARDRHGAVTVQAGDLILPGVDVVTEEDRLAGTLESPRVVDDGSLVAWSGLIRLCRGRGGGEEQRDRPAGPAAATPLRDPLAPIAHGSVRVLKRLRAAEAGAAGKRRTT